MKSKSVFGLSILGAVAAVSMTAVANADPICDTLEQCRAMQAQVEARIQELQQNEIPVLDDIVKNENGSVRQMSQFDAEQYCRSHGSRLPTARELALVSQSMGALGIRETAHAGVVETDAAVQAEVSQMHYAGYYPIYTMNTSNQPSIDFYFSYIGYQRPAGDLGNNFFWTSTVHPDHFDLAYGLSGATGFIYDYDRNYSYADRAVRCLR